MMFDDRTVMLNKLLKKRNIILFTWSCLLFYAEFWLPKGFHEISVPIIYHLIDKSLFARDYFVISATQLYPPVFHYFMAAISTVETFPFVYQVISFLLNTLFIFSSFFLAKEVLNDDNTATLAAIIISLPRWSLEVVEASFLMLNHRTFVLAFIPLILYIYIKNIKEYKITKHLLIYASLGLLYNVHPICALPIILITLGTDLFLKRKECIYYFLLILAFSLPYNLHYLSTQPLSHEMLQKVVETRTYYHTLEYRLKFLLTTLIYTPILALVGYKLKKDKTTIDRIIIKWIAIFCFISIAAICLSCSLQTSLLHLLPRVWRYGYILSILYVVFLATMFWRKEAKYSKFLSILIIFFLLGSTYPPDFDEVSAKDVLKKYAENTVTPIFHLLLTYDKPLGKFIYDNFKDSKSTILKKLRELQKSSKKECELKEIGCWIKENTNKSVLIMTYPPHLHVLRSYSLRSMLVTYKDGAMGMFSEDVFLRWQKLYNEVKHGDPIEIAKKYSANLIVTPKDVNLPLKRAYSTENYIVYLVE